MVGATLSFSAYANNIVDYCVDRVGGQYITNCECADGILQDRLSQNEYELVDIAATLNIHDMEDLQALAGAAAACGMSLNDVSDLVDQYDDLYEEAMFECAPAR